MAERRPLVMIGGEYQQLPVGDTLPGAGAGGYMVYIPFYTTDNTLDRIPLVTGGLVPFKKTDGSDSNIALIS